MSAQGNAAQVQFCEGFGDYRETQMDLGSTMPGCFEIGKNPSRDVQRQQGGRSNPLIFPDKAAAGFGPRSSNRCRELESVQPRATSWGHLGWRRGGKWRQRSSNISRCPTQVEEHHVSFLFRPYRVKLQEEFWNLGI